jgi:crotonobetainyl-CoA:carnitine CoA-transferase CaiB-like acyl-CoA transferase
VSGEARQGPLSGVTVVALEQAVSAPMCTRVLADFGARVIKVEPPGTGDFTRHYDSVVHGHAAHFVWVNRGKESVVLDLKSAHGREAMERLLARADVFVTNLAPGAAERLGLGQEETSRRHPRLVQIQVDGYGPGGPLSGKRAYDLLIQAESGACAVTGTAGAPAKSGPPVADVATGLYAALSVLALLYERSSDAADAGSEAAPEAVPRAAPETTPGAAPETATWPAPESTPGAAPEAASGAEQEALRPPPLVSVAMLDVMAELMGYPLTYTQHTGVDQEPAGMGSPAVAPYGAYPTGDGQTVVLGTTNDAEWQRFARALLGRTDLAEDLQLATTAQRVAARGRLDEAVGAWCAGLPLDEIQRRADAARIGNARLNRPGEVLDHPQLAARDRWRDIAVPGGTTRAVLPPPVLSGRELSMGAVPALGEHTGKVLAELGLDQPREEEQ